MISFETLILNGIYLLFPLLVYLIYVAYIRNMDMQEKDLIFEFALLSSIFLLMRYNKNDASSMIILINLPLLLAYIRKKIHVSVLLSMILIFFLYKNFHISFFFLVGQYLLYFFLFLVTRHKKKYTEHMINSFVVIDFFLTSCFFFPVDQVYSIKNILYLICNVGIFISYSYLMVYLFHKGEDIANFASVLKELEREKRLRTSISKLTHELKNPIAVCNGYLEMMNIDDKKKTKKYVSIIESEMKRALNVIQDFSSLGKIKDLEKEEMDLSLLMEELQGLILPLYKKCHAKLKIKTDEEVYILADYQRLKQVFINLLKNALEARKEEKDLSVKVEVKNLKTKVKIKIEDNGKGMDKETLSHLFEEFYTTKEQGTGLGVAYSKEVIELHGGSITYQSNLEEGTKVLICLPKEKKS